MYVTEQGAGVQNDYSVITEKQWSSSLAFCIPILKVNLFSDFYFYNIMPKSVVYEI